ncbi:MAG: AMP-binding protein, partial [Desulfobacterales bacterium]|nr:AMP-binding protein [Desulfobacterales bacterium]
PIGVSGELYIGGNGLAREYLNNPEKTRENFIPDPFNKGDRLYKTGDLGRWLSDGSIEFLGRIDFQVKIRGFRIELGEIEFVLSSHKEIDDCIVIAKEEALGDKSLVAYYTSLEEVPISDLRGFLGETLPDYMIPQRFIHLNALPLNTSGKVDRSALPDPEGIRPRTAVEYVAPGTELEERIADIWQDILGIEQAGIQDNFFELGGHSLTATKVISRIKRELDHDIALKVIFEDPTIQGLVEAIERDDGEERLPDIEPLPKKGSYELSHAQKRLWFLDQMMPNSPVYNVPSALLIKGNISIDAMQKALKAVVDRHEILRTVFVGQDSGPVQMISDSLEVLIPLNDITGTDEIEFSDIATKEAMKPFSLEKGPLFRASLFKVSEDSHLFVFIMHHIISDCWSMEVIIREMITAYIAIIGGNEADLGDLIIQYKDYASWQNRLMEEGALKDQEDYWVTTLDGDLPVLDLPADRPRPPIVTTNGSCHSFEIGPELMSSLKDLTISEDTTLYMVLLSVLNVYLGKICNQDDIIIGAPIAGRNHPDIEGLIGFFVNTLALRTDISGDPSFSDVVERVKETCIDAYSNQDYPFDRLIDKLNLFRDTSRTPVFNVMFAMQDVSGVKDISQIGDMSYNIVEIHQQTTKFDMTIFAF